MGFFNVAPALEPGVGFHGISLRDAHPRFPGDSVFSPGNRDERTARQGGRVSERHFGEIALLSSEGKIFALREIRIAIPHQDPAQIRMSGEA
jgi:hypothetical protein